MIFPVHAQDDADRVHPRYANWQYELLRNSSGQVPPITAFAFVGLTEHYRTSLCLFYFTFQVQCEKRTRKNAKVHECAHSAYYLRNTNLRPHISKRRNNSKWKALDRDHLRNGRTIRSVPVRCKSTLSSVRHKMFTSTMLLVTRRYDLEIGTTSADLGSLFFCTVTAVTHVPSLTALMDWNHISAHRPCATTDLFRSLTSAILCKALGERHQTLPKKFYGGS